ncbi:uncharacterized protein METZ01_LOCUS104099 [marine metagenome]|uniref:Uncharacterized protein n=1 Tax=marine metagenome TaxID=408172 RepID=A0A381WFJ7_9ZZZZ
MSEETNQPPAAGGSQESKKQTVRISLPPKPAASPTIKISVPPAGAAKAASTIKIPVPPKKTAPAVATGQRKAPPATAAEARRKISVDDIRKDNAPFEEESSFEAKPKRQKARVKKAAPVDNPFDITVALVTALSAIGLAAFLWTLGQV